MNTATLVGNLTDDVDVRYSDQGTAVAKMTVAVSRRVRRNGQWTQQTDGFFVVTAFAQLAEHAANSVGKGSRVMVTGRLKQDSYEDSGGVRRSSVQLIAEEIAPSLRFATAEVTKATGDDGGDAEEG